MNDVLLHTELVLQKAFRQKAPPHSKLLHDEAFTQRSSYTQTFLFTWKLLHRETIALSSFHTHRNFYAEKPLHGAAFTHTETYMQKSLYTEQL